ncbi:hypothetical protein J3F83DRAFT_659466 [Trichoderma novae-zelandiae]
MPHALVELVNEFCVQLPRAWRENSNWGLFKIQFVAVYVIVAGLHTATCAFGSVVNSSTSHASCFIAKAVFEELLTVIIAFPFI